MTRQRGKHSMNVPHGMTGGRELATRLLVGLGVVVSVGLVAVSAMLNYRMGYRSADTELDGIVYGAGAACGDGLKAIAPFMMAAGYKNKDYLACVAAAVVYVIITAYSFTAALGFAAEHRSNKEASADAAILLGGSVRDEMQRIKERRDALKQQPSPQEVEAELERVFKQPAFEGGRSVGEISSNCTLDRKSTRTACQQVPLLRARLAQANEAQQLDHREDVLRTQVTATDGGRLRTTTDPQVEAVRRVSAIAVDGVAREDVAFYLAVLLALFVELGSGMGLYVSTTPLRSLTQRGERKYGDIAGYVKSRVVPERGGEVSITDIYADYSAWCRTHGDEAVSRHTFGQEFGKLAQEIGVRHLWRDKRERYQDIRLVKAA